MACGSCGKGSKRHVSTGGDLSQFAYLSPRQLRLLKLKQEAEEKNSSAEEGQE
jgi:hypothetical protein